MSPSLTSYEAGTSSDWDSDTKVCLFKYCQKRHCFLLGTQPYWQIQLPSLPWSCLVPRLVYPIMILNIVSTNIFFPLGKMIGTVRSWTSFILSSQSWEIGSPPTGGAGRKKLSADSVVPASVIRIWPIHISWRKILHLCVRTVSVFWQFTTFWWSAIILLKKGKIYLVEEIWWNRLDSTPH